MDTPSTLQLVAVLVVGFWSFVYIVWETFEDVVEGVHDTALEVVLVDAHAAFVKPRVLVHLSNWCWRVPSHQGISDRALFVQLCRLAVLEDAYQELAYMDLCVEMVSARHRCIPRCLVRAAVEQLIPIYRLHHRTPPHLWPFLLSARPRSGSATTLSD